MLAICRQINGGNIGVMPVSIKLPSELNVAASSILSEWHMTNMLEHDPRRSLALHRLHSRRFTDKAKRHQKGTDTLHREHSIEQAANGLVK
jgi:hypothetical protein